MQQNRINSLEFGPYEMIDDPVAYENHVHVPKSAVRISLNTADLGWNIATQWEAAKLMFLPLQLHAFNHSKVTSG